MMGTMRQIEPVGCLPPSKEVLLEIQVSNFIKDFLFSGVDECRTAPVKPQLGVRSSSAFQGHARFGQKENNPTSVQPDSSGQNEAVFVDMPTETSISSDEIPSACQSASELDRSESERFFDSSSGPGEIRIKVDDQWEEGTELGTKTCIYSNTSWKHTVKWTETRLGKATTGIEDGANPVSSGYQALAIEGGEGKQMHITRLSRTETFPCKSKTQRERQLTCTRNDSNGVCDVETEIKHSCRKPPRPPPRLTRQSSDQKGCSGLLTRCASDTNLLLQSSRRAKLERKRKMAAAASTVTSLWALVITLCFAVAMIVQGVSSQGSRALAMKTTNASSPTLFNTPSSVKMSLPASLPKGSLSDGGQGNSGFDSSKWTEEGELDVQRERTTQALPILKIFDTQSSGTSIS